MYGGALKRIRQLVRKPTAVRAGMLDLLRLCAKAVPSPVWSRFRKLDFERDQQSLSTWLRKLLKSEPPPTSITGLCFGLFNPILKDGKPTSCLYLAGSERFERRLKNPDWACDPEYFPEGRYSSSKVLTKIYRDANAAIYSDANVPAEVGAQAELALCLGYSCLVVADWCRGPLRPALFGDAPLRGVAVGFDSGDLVLIDVLRSALQKDRKGSSKNR